MSVSSWCDRWWLGRAGAVVALIGVLSLLVATRQVRADGPPPQHDQQAHSQPPEGAGGPAGMPDREKAPPGPPKSRDRGPEDRFMPPPPPRDRDGQWDGRDWDRGPEGGPGGPPPRGPESYGHYRDRGPEDRFMPPPPPRDHDGQWDGRGWDLWTVDREAALSVLRRVGRSPMGTIVTAAQKIGLYRLHRRATAMVSGMAVAGTVAGIVDRKAALAVLRRVGRSRMGSIVTVARKIGSCRLRHRATAMVSGMAVVGPWTARRPWRSSATWAGAVWALS